MCVQLGIPSLRGVARFEVGVCCDTRFQTRCWSHFDGGVELACAEVYAPPLGRQPRLDCTVTLQRAGAQSTPEIQSPAQTAPKPSKAPRGTTPPERLSPPRLANGLSVTTVEQRERKVWVPNHLTRAQERLHCPSHCHTGQARHGVTAFHKSLTCLLGARQAAWLPFLFSCRWRQEWPSPCSTAANAAMTVQACTSLYM